MRHLEPDPELETRVRADLRPLFDNGAEIVSSERLPGVGNSQVILRVLKIDFWIIQSGGSLSVLVSPSSASDSWRSVESLLMVIETEHLLPPDPVYGSLADLGRLLESRLQRLDDALSPDRFPSTVEAAKQAKMKGMIALKPRAAVVPTPRRKILPTVIGIIVRLIRFLSPKPKNSHTKFLPIGSDLELERQVKDEFDAVFRNFKAHISSNERVNMMDFATVTFDAGNIRIRASRDRGSIDVSIAPLHALRLWNHLGVALQALQENNENVQSVPPSMLSGAGMLLERDFLRLNDAFSEVNYPAIQERISKIKKTLKQNWVEDFNRKSKLYHATS